ncbi:hypothetical protein NZK27_00710 [Synechococcus sp. FGCU-3]|nr:hypothetical protein [Synechococcus sp. FGCU3]
MSKANERSRFPTTLERLRKRGVEFKYVQDMGPHTKYFYALDECMRSGLPLVTIDDDCVYWSWLLSRLVKTSFSSPTKLIGYRVRRIKLAEDGSPLPYSEWHFCESTDDHPLNFITGVSGAFYPLDFIKILSLYGDDFTETCLKADDVWINYVAAKHDIRVRQVDSAHWDFPQIPGSQRQSLWSTNQRGGNDVQIKRTYDQLTLAKLKIADAAFNTNSNIV